MAFSSQMSSSAPAVLITGGGTGIGRATALRFIKEGWDVILVGRRLAPLQEVEAKHQGRVLALQCDITNAQNVNELANRLSQHTDIGQRLMALVNNAGAYERRSFMESDDELWSRLFEINVLGSVRVTRGLMPLLEKNRGVIVNVSSTLGVRPVPYTSVYSATKAAMVNWTQTLALEVAPKGVRVNCVNPGIVDTPIHGFHTQEASEKAKTLEAFNELQPLGRVGRPEDVAHGIWSLCAPGSEWITGSVLSVDGGISLV